MNLELRYWGKSGIAPTAGGWSLSFAPNLARPKVFFDQALKFPVRFREAISALHEVVVGDFTFKPKDHSAYRAWREVQAQQDAAIRRAHYEQAYAQELTRIAQEPVRPTLEADFRAKHALYWRARRAWANDLSRNDPELFRSLVPCDPVVTVAPDVVFFECFAKDEASYGCLFVDRDAFSGAPDAGLGTTNVDYSLALFDSFQALRSYKSTRLAVDPTGFEVKTAGHAEFREEKIDLPPSWLRGFGQLQGAMTLPSRTVELSVDAVYSLLAYLTRHREKSGPRSLRFELSPGQPTKVVLEPWNVEVVSSGAPFDGAKPETIKVWGRRRLRVLQRLLPLATHVSVRLLGSGLPSIWTVHMGEMRFVLGLSGWTTNDWTSGAALELLAGDFRPEARVVSALEQHLQRTRAASLVELMGGTGSSRDVVLGSLHALCKHGQAVFDFSTGLYRYRPVMPFALSEAVVGPEPEEVQAGKRLAEQGALKITRTEALPNGRRLLVGRVSSTDCEAILDADGGFTKATCQCSHFHRFRLRAGPCRHLLALRLTEGTGVLELLSRRVTNVLRN